MYTFEFQFTSCNAIQLLLFAGKKVKASHTRYQALGPALIPVYKQSAGDYKSSTRW